MKLPDDLPRAYRIAALTPRELRAAVLYADGLSNSEVGRALGALGGLRRRIDAMNQTRRAILDKLGVADTRQLREATLRRDLKERTGIIL